VENTIQATIKTRRGTGWVLPLASLLLVAAHYLRAGDTGLCLFFAGFAAAAGTRQAWMRPVLVVAMLFAVGVWADAWSGFLNMRLAFGQPVVRLSLIMAVPAVAAVAALAWLLTTGGRAFFNRRSATAGSAAGAALLTVLLLALARGKATVPVLLADRFLPGLGWLEILALAAYAAWLVHATADPDRTPVLRRRVWGLFSLVFFLQLAAGLAGLEKMLMTGELHLPVPALIAGGPIYRGGGYFMLILYAATLVLVGPAWCSWLCYIGAWDDYASRFRNGKIKALPGWARHGRLLTLALVLGAAAALRGAGTPAAVAAALAGAFGILGVGVMAFASRRLGVMAHCTAFCPIGLLSALAGKISPWRIRIGPDCTRCGACTRVCRYGALEESDFAAGRPGVNCTLCGDCLAPCRQGALSYRFPGLTAPATRRAFLVTVVSLHAVFLGVARM
jgi:NAD-dependent dihydropyrimidine dehydrogenase PreA subunit